MTGHWIRYGLERERGAKAYVNARVRGSLNYCSTHRRTLFASASAAPHLVSARMSSKTGPSLPHKDELQ